MHTNHRIVLPSWFDVLPVLLSVIVDLCVPASCSLCASRMEPLKKGLPGYMLGLMLLVPSAALMVACWLCPCVWLWRRWRREPERGDSVTRVRQNVSVEFRIPEKVVGFVIGRKGSSVRQVETESGARVQFKDQQGTKDKMVVITGRPSCVQAAQDLIQQAVDEKLTSEKNQQMLALTVPQRAVGKIIGRQGANIRSIQRESGARVTMASGGRSDAVRTCEVVGSPEQLTRAVALIQEMVAQSETRVARPSHSTEGVDCQTTEIRTLELPQTSEYIPVFVSSIDGTGGIWVQPIEEEDPARLEALVEEMTEYYSGLSEGCPDNASVGDVFAAPFEHDSSWYRVRVTSVGEQGVEVLYLDYGDYGTVSMSSLRELRSEYYQLRAQCVRCQLDSLIPTGGLWSEAGLQCLEEVTHSAAWKVLMARVVSREGTPKIQLVDTSTDKDIDIADYLVSSGHAQWASSHPPYPRSLRYRRDGPHPLLSIRNHVTLVDQSDGLPVYVSHVQSPDLLFVQPVGYELVLTQLCERLNSVYSLSDEGLSRVKMGDLVAACFPSDKQWYRGQVISFNESDCSVLLRYLDYGLVVCLPLQHVRALRDEFCEEIVYCLPCSLGNVQPHGPGGWSDESYQFVREATKPGDWCVLSAKLTGYSIQDSMSIPTISIGYASEAVTVNAELVTSGLAESKGRLSPEGGEGSEAGEGVRHRNVKFQWSGAGDVAIAGSFTDWKEVKLKRRSTGEFETDLDIPKGSHEYKFLVDGTWQHDHSQPTTFNSYGTLNNTLSA